MTRRRTTDSTENLGGGVLILVKNGLTYSSLSTQHLFSLDPSSDHLAITIKIKKASPIHLFNLYVPLICSSTSDSHPKSFSLFLLSSSPLFWIYLNSFFLYNLIDKYLYIIQLLLLFVIL